MSVNSTHSTTEYLLNDYCSRSKNTILISSCVLMIKIVLVLPLCISVLYLGHRRRRQQRSLSHSEVFTYSLSQIELVWPLGFLVYLYGSCSGSIAMMLVGISSCSFILFGQMMIHVLTCVERYLAVVHPVTYLMFRNQRGVRIRNISMGCGWLLCFVLMSLQNSFTTTSNILMISSMAVSVVVIAFCCFAVLRALLRPGPGEGGRGKVDRSKLRAFYTLAAISGVLWLWFVALLFCFTVIASVLKESTGICELMASVNCLNIPASLVAPVLYLHRAGKRSCCCFNRERDDP